MDPVRRTSEKAPFTMFTMKTATKLAGALTVAGTLLATSYATAGHSLGQPDGIWTTIDDDGTTKKSMLKIFTWRDKVYGKVVLLLQKPQDTLCQKCKGDLHCKPVNGMTIMTGLTWDGEGWSQGRVLDPEKGKRYWIKIKYNNSDGTEILAKGSLDKRGVIGRKQTWRWCGKGESSSCFQAAKRTAKQTGADNGECAAGR